jgi:hypothetical protein
MSGGHYQYQYRYLECLADEIERDFLNDGVVKSDFGENRTYDYLSDATDEEREIILDEVKSLIVDLKNCAERAKALEWLTSGDYGSTSYIEILREKGFLFIQEQQRLIARILDGNATYRKNCENCTSYTGEDLISQRCMDCTADNFSQYQKKKKFENKKI